MHVLSGGVDACTFGVSKYNKQQTNFDYLFHIFSVHEYLSDQQLHTHNLILDVHNKESGVLKLS